MREVVIAQRVLTHYRVPFLEGLHRSLAAEGVRLRVLFGEPPPGEVTKSDGGELSWAEPVRNRYVRVGRRHLVWQPVLRSCRHADLVVVEQASRLVVNYPLLAWRRLGGPSVAFWGHGRNRDGAAASAAGEAIKARLVRSADWWFCYTEGTAQYVRSLGVSPEQTTVVQNAIDTTQLARWRAEISADELAVTRTELGITSGPVALALGSIYPAKRPTFLVESADFIKSVLPGFQLVVVGDGPDRHVLDGAARTRSWIHVVGVQTGRNLVRYASLGALVLNPGLVGLSVLDSFALGLPMVTCDVPNHSPEIEYLENGVNGLVLPGNATAERYADEVCALASDPTRLDLLRTGCRTSADRYTLDEMVRRFVRGVVSALARR